jgi:hypothetical protein
MQKSGGDTRIGRTNWNLNQTSEENGDDQLRKESEEESQWVKGVGLSQAMGGKLSWTWRKTGSKWPLFGPPVGQQNDNGNWLRRK